MTIDARFLASAAAALLVLGATMPVQAGAPGKTKPSPAMQDIHRDGGGASKTSVGAVTDASGAQFRTDKATGGGGGPHTALKFGDNDHAVTKSGKATGAGGGPHTAQPHEAGGGGGPG